MILFKHDDGVNRQLHKDYLEDFCSDFYAKVRCDLQRFTPGLYNCAAKIDYCQIKTSIVNFFGLIFGWEILVSHLIRLLEQVILILWEILRLALSYIAKVRGLLKVLVF